MTRPAPPSTVVIVGASLAGTWAALTLREEGFDGRIVLIGEEQQAPYDRPPLSKQFLTGRVRAPDLALPVAADLTGVELLAGRRATGLDLASRQVETADGPVAFDALIIASGARARRLPADADCPEARVVRTLDDAELLRQDLARGGEVVVVGGGFIGTELAAVAADLGAETTLVHGGPTILPKLGTRIGDVAGRLHRDHGVRLLGGRTVRRVRTIGDRREVLLDDGSVLTADTVAVGIGAVPATEWLRSSGLAMDPSTGGVLCDATCAASAPGVYAAGDVANFFNPWSGTTGRIEHWTNAVEQGRHAARAVLVGPDQATAYAPVPYFWSDQHDRKIQFVGECAPGDRVEILTGSVEDCRFLAGYFRQNRLVGAVAFSEPRALALIRRHVAARAHERELAVTAG